MERQKRIAILGSTGSIGTQTLDVVRSNSELVVTALAAYGNIVELERQIREFHPKLVCVYEEEKAEKLRQNISDLSIKVTSKMDGLIEVATEIEVDIIVASIVGMIGIRPTIAAIRAGKDIALANKETLVTAGHIIMPLIKEHHVKLLPVDSEHSAIFQCLNGENKRELHKILLTASGGPFRGYTLEQMKDIQPEDALKHPNWDMGKKITIDSATMVNKGLEVMEAKWLFDVSPDEIEVVVQPQSIIHSMVEFMDGAILAQLGMPDMRLAIQYALLYPERRSFGGKRLDFSSLKKIDFETPNLYNFRGLALAYGALYQGGSVPTVFNAANEYAVQKFLNHEIGFLDIPSMIEAAMASHTRIENPSLEDILEVEAETHEFLESRW